MRRIRNVLALFLSLILFICIGSGVSDTLLNGTSIYLATGDSYPLYQGYAISLKSVSSDGSIWIQLTENDKIVKSDIVGNKDYFIYNKTNRTILSAKVDNVYSGSSEKNLVLLFPVHQFIDPDLPAPSQTDVMPENPGYQDNGSQPVRLYTPGEPLIWTLGITFILVLFYILRKLW